MCQTRTQRTSLNLQLETKRHRSADGISGSRIRISADVHSLALVPLLLEYSLSCGTKASQQGRRCSCLQGPDTHDYPRRHLNKRLMGLSEGKGMESGRGILSQLRPQIMHMFHTQAHRASPDLQLGCKQHRSADGISG